MNKNIISCIAISALLTSCSYLPTWMGGRVDEKPKLVGERFSALPITGQAQPDDSLKSSPVRLPAPAANADWVQPTSLFTAATGNLAGGEFKSKTSATAGDGNDFESSLIATPIVAGGVVYAMDASGIISAHDASNVASVRWKATDIADTHGHDVFGGGLSFDAGVVYAVAGHGKVAAFDAASGKLLWAKDFTTPMRAAPRISGDRLIVVTMDSQTYALSAKTGDILWDHRGINETAGVMNNVSPTIVGGSVIVPYASGELFALNLADGSPQWSDTLLQSKGGAQGSGAFTGIGGDPIIDGNIAIATSTNGVTAAINMATGQRVWQQAIASMNTPWLAGDELFLLTADNVLVDMVKYSGKIRWATQLESFIDKERKLKPISWKGAVLVADKLLLTNSQGEIVFVSAADGKIVKTMDSPSKITSAPVVAGGRLYLVGSDATLYCLYP